MDEVKERCAPALAICCPTVGGQINLARLLGCLCRCSLRIRSRNRDQSDYAVRVGRN